MTNLAILVVDDDPVTRTLLTKRLIRQEFSVETAESGEKGVDLFKASMHDLIFLDLKMPGLNGVETLMRLREVNTEVPIYIITAFYAEYFDQLKEARENDIRFEVLRKPIGGDQIVLLSRSVLEGPISH